jgi:hypothetical protein
LLAFALPLNQFSLRTMPQVKQTDIVINDQTGNIPHPNSALAPDEHTLVSAEPTQNIASPKLNPRKYIYILYISITALLLLRFVMGVLRFVLIMAQSRSLNYNGTKLYLSTKVPGSTSFMRLLFIHPDLKDHPELSQIISHENIHASQYHTLDVLLVELLAAAMWFNPVVWFLRRSLQQLHEYLADEGVINAGYDRLGYQKLLVNHIAEETLLLSSGFQSSIKKRIIMITKHKSSNAIEIKWLVLMPLTILLFIGIACVNKPTPVDKNTSVAVVDSAIAPQPYETQFDTSKVTKSEEVFAAIGLTKMNVLYLGIDNPVDIAVSGVPADKVRPSITNGTIIKTRNSYIVRPRMLGNAIVQVDALINDKWKTVRVMDFRVKRVPDPVAYVAHQKGGGISKEKLLKASNLEAMMENFDFDLHFTITQFTVTTTTKGFVMDENSKSSMLTPSQINLINKLSIGQKVYFTDIKAEGPDGTERELSPVQFTITE